ncbi:efflux RND transporter periplasmic adaptor subunit [Ornithobacterium rhinotracheale]|uniref:efflux RND transporter periplasmic adaptor subunit n=1 Tax=Ornithobacterium rhinotracheale TaxID=28251 RepID=UPI00129C616D|nr:efflux RND transporter periplasmic adaptor subunit [Ornithobacterium rhinotracheale]MRJ10300.1 efflux RND transporter periplasmic adaptor subunit [Ornithobacterium rhinotracheale]
MKKLVIPVIIIIALIVGVFFILKGNKKSNEEKVAIVKTENSRVAVQVAKVKEDHLSGQFSANGTFVPEKETTVSPEMGGQVVAIYVDEGSYVRAGQTIAKLKGDKVNVGLDASRAQLENAKAVLVNAESQLARFEAAYKTGGVTDQQVDQMRLQVKQLQSQVKSAQAGVRNAQLSSGDTNVVAKVSGIVNRKLVETGAVVGAGTPIVQIVNISSLKLKVNVDESLVTKLHVGDVVSVKPTVLNEPIQGKITFIAPMSDGALKFPVEITVNNQDQRLKAGMYAVANFDQNGEGDAPALVIPRDAFVGSVSQNQVFQVVDSTAVLKTIQSGRNLGDVVEVVSGLKQGDVVVTSGQINLDNGTKVKIIK